MSLYRDILLLGWPLFIGLAVCVALYARLREQWAQAQLGEPAVITRALLFFAEGDVLRALVLLEGEKHPICGLLSGFWKRIPVPRQWEGTQLIAEFQKHQALLQAPLVSDIAAFGRTVGITVLLEIGWLAVHRPGLLQPPYPWTKWITVAGSVAILLPLVAIWGFLCWRGLNRRLSRLISQSNHVIYQSIEALDHGRRGLVPGRATVMQPRTAAGPPNPVPSGETGPPSSYISRAYKQ